MSIEQIFSDSCREVAAAFHDLAAAIREQTAARANSVTTTAAAPVIEKPTTAKGAVEEAKAKAAADKKAQEEAAKVAAEMEAKEKAAAKAKQVEAGAADAPDYNKVVYPKLLGLVNAKGKDAWLKLADEFKNEAGVPPAKGANVDPKDYTRLVARIDELMGEGEV